MAGSWNANINFIQDGERVDATVSGRPDRALTDRTQYLKDRIDALAADAAGTNPIKSAVKAPWGVIGQRV